MRSLFTVEVIVLLSTLWGCCGQLVEPDPSHSPIDDQTSIHDAWLDPTSGLTWQVTPPAKGMDLDRAQGYCSDLSLAGYSDWRLPTIDELLSLIRGCPRTALGGTCPPVEDCPWSSLGQPPQCECMILGCGDGGGPADNFYLPVEVKRSPTPGRSTAAHTIEFWSASILPTRSTTAWKVDFYTGGFWPSVRSNPFGVRCVRGIRRTERSSEGTESDQLPTKGQTDGIRVPEFEGVGEVFVLTGGVWVRSAPSSSSSTSTGIWLKKGQRVVVEKQQGHYSQARMEDGSKGWIHSAFLGTSNPQRDYQRNVSSFRFGMESVSFWMQPDYARSEKVLREAVAAEPENPEVRLYYAVAVFKQRNNCDEAIRHLKIGVDLYQEVRPGPVAQQKLLPEAEKVALACGLSGR